MKTLLKTCKQVSFYLIYLTSRHDIMQEYVFTHFFANSLFARIIQHENSFPVISLLYTHVGRVQGCYCMLVLSDWNDLCIVRESQDYQNGGKWKVTAWQTFPSISNGRFSWPVLKSISERAKPIWYRISFSEWQQISPGHWRVIGGVWSHILRKQPAPHWYHKNTVLDIDACSQGTQRYQQKGQSTEKTLAIPATAVNGWQNLAWAIDLIQTRWTNVSQTTIIV